MKIFWSWQSDTPGKTGRHFIKDALETAIRELQESDEISEPIERDRASEMELDHDRKGVSGSPDLANTIFAKIEKATVFVSDVTPVSQLEKLGEDGKPFIKKHINGNVAIELGYALRCLSDSSLLMIMNSHYGSRLDLPFDLANKAGPIIYKLPPSADKKEIEEEKKKLVGTLKSALKEYIGKQNIELDYPEVPANKITGLFFAPSDILGTAGDQYDGDYTEYKVDIRKYIALRVFPNRAPIEPFQKSDLLNKVRASSLPPFWRDDATYYRPNKFGAIALDPKNNTTEWLDAITQVFPNGEIWGINNYLLRERQGRKYIPTGALEETLIKCVKKYSHFLIDELELSLPLIFEFSGKGLLNYSIIAGKGPFKEYWPLLENDFCYRIKADRIEDGFEREIAEKLLDRIFDLTGYARPH